MRRRLPRRIGPALAIVLLAAFVPPSAGAAPGALAPPVAPDSVLLTVTVDPDGDATWQVRYRFVLADENATAAFSDYEADVEADPASYRDGFAARIDETVADAAAATGREMAARDFGVEATTDPFTGDQGFVTYTFVWEDFAAANDTHLVIGDAIDGLFIDRNTTLTVVWPSGYQAGSIRPRPDERRTAEVTWMGERSFAPGTPRIVVTTGNMAARTAASRTTDAGDRPPALLVGIGIAAIATIGAVWWFRDGRGEDTTPPGTEGLPPELLSNEEQVLGLLEDRGGRIKQGEIADALGWSEMKTSNVVRDMRDEGTIEVFRLGRENVVSLPEEHI